MVYLRKSPNKIVEKDLKKGFIAYFKAKKEAKMFQYKFEDKFLKSLDKYFDNELDNKDFLEVTNCDEKLDIDEENLNQRDIDNN